MITDDPKKAREALAARARPGAEAVPGETVAALHRRFRDKVEAAVDRALPDPPAFRGQRALLHRYALAAVRGRQGLSAKRLAEMARRDRKQLKAALHQLPRYDRIRWRPGILLASWRARRNKFYDRELFQGRDRLYYPLVRETEEKSQAQQEVEAWLREQGYSDIDYIGGHATDDRGNKRKIGKLLAAAATPKTDELRARFEKDPARAGDLMIVVSRDPTDIARMSGGREWQSCMTPGGMYFRRVPMEIWAGSIVAYLVRSSDPEINDPLGRILLKPFHGREGTILKAARAYGLHDANFDANVQAIADATVNAGKIGEFELDSRAYSDMMNRHARRFEVGDMTDIPVARFLRAAGVAFSRSPDGQVTINGNLNLRDRNIPTCRAGCATSPSRAASS